MFVPFYSDVSVSVCVGSIKYECECECVCAVACVSEFTAHFWAFVGIMLPASVWMCVYECVHMVVRVRFASYHHLSFHRFKVNKFITFLARSTFNKITKFSSQCGGFAIQMGPKISFSLFWSEYKISHTHTHTSMQVGNSSTSPSSSVVSKTIWEMLKLLKRLKIYPFIWTALDCSRALFACHLRQNTLRYIAHSLTHIRINGKYHTHSLTLSIHTVTIIAKNPYSNPYYSWSKSCTLRIFGCANVRSQTSDCYARNVIASSPGRVQAIAARLSQHFMCVCNFVSRRLPRQTLCCSCSICCSMFRYFELWCYQNDKELKREWNAI